MSGETALQDGLLGFRGIPASIIGVAEALAKAYPLLVGPALERAKANAGPGQDSLEDAWLREVGISALALAADRAGFGEGNQRCMAVSTIFKVSKPELAARLSWGSGGVDQFSGLSAC